MAAEAGTNRLTDIRVFASRHIRPTRVAEVEYASGIDLTPWLRYVSRDESPHVLGKRDAERRRPLSGATMVFRVERDLGSRHHDVAILVVNGVSRQLPRLLERADRLADGCPMNGRRDRRLRCGEMARG